MKSEYKPQEFENKWIEFWHKKAVYKTPPIKSQNQKKYILAMFPYPSGVGLHVGHVRIYTGTDVIARFLRMKGYSVLHPMGWDAFGLPAENAAIKAKKNPMDMVPANIQTFKKQMQSLGLSYDWDKEFATTDPEYYQITQWLFIQFFKAGLLEKRMTSVYYCPSCKTGLAEEEVLANGTHERCGKLISRRDLPQWIFKITKYAESLLKTLNTLDWPKGILEMQKNWIGKKTGINIDYQVVDSKKNIIDQKITVFTTRPDTNFGATFVVLAPEHRFVKKILADEYLINQEQKKKIQDYVKNSLAKTDQDRINEGKKKTGVFTGFYALNNLNNEHLPIWISDFVLSEFGTGAVVGVPGHDRRDFDFANEMKLPIKRVVVGKDNNLSEITRIEEVQEDEGKMINSGFLNGLSIDKATEVIMDYLEKKSWGKRVTSYHLRDWIFSRQRYWGEPIPMINCPKCGWQPTPEKELPLKLPYLKSYEPSENGESPLSQVKSFVETVCPKCTGKARRETDTMPNWAGSCWYFIRFAMQNVNNKSSFQQGLVGQANFKLKIKNLNWLPVDWYLGGAEHAVLHLLYSRFWMHVLNDLGLIDFREPFIRLRNVGMVLAEDNRKMSKSYGNVINPNDVIAEVGTDALRVYEMFMAPFNMEIAWSKNSLQGMNRFLKRFYQLVVSNAKVANTQISDDIEAVSELQTLIIKVESDITNVKFNTAISSIMKFLNFVEDKITVKQTTVLSLSNLKKLVKLIAPFAPFIAEELWQNVLNEKKSIHLSSWPEIEKIKLNAVDIIIPVQINGKIRDQLKINPKEATEKNVLSLALKLDNVKKYVSNNKYRAIYVKNKILSLVI